jgi:DNA-binding transcriptional LysR family regulator
MSFDLRHLRYVLAAAEHRSFFRAALALEIEQSSMSRNIVRLERRLGVKLFRRSHAGISPTFAGEEFIRTARHILAKADQLFVAMQSAGEGKSGRLTVGYSNPGQATQFGAALLAWRKLHPDIALERIEGPREALIAGLDSGVIDIAVLAGEWSYTGLNNGALWTEPLMVGLPASHPLANRDSLEWPDLEGETFLIPDDAAAYADCIRAANIAPAIHTLQLSSESILSMLGTDDGVTLTSRPRVGEAAYPEVVLRELRDAANDKARIPFSGYWRKDNDNLVLCQFLAFVRERHGR